MGKAINLAERELWIVDWIAKSGSRQDLLDLNTEELMVVLMREWIKMQFDHYELLRKEAKTWQIKEN